MAALILAMFMAKGLRFKRELAGEVDEQKATYQFLQSHSEGKIPVVIAAPLLFFELSHYAADKGGTRFIYLADVPSALQYTGTDTPERGLLELKKWAPLEVEDFHRFCASQSEFLVYGYPGRLAWLIPELTRQGRRLVVKAENGDQLLFLSTSESDQGDKSIGAGRKLQPVPGQH
jgi:hypothetical protein